MKKQKTSIYDINKFLWVLADIVGDDDDAIARWASSDPDNTSAVKSFIEPMITEEILIHSKKARMDAIEYLEKFLDSANEEEVESFWMSLMPPFSLGENKRLPFEIVYEILDKNLEK